MSDIGTTPRVVALGGGHGLAVTLSALRDITSRITAVVTVADNGGSSGRLRDEFGIIPPGDLRMALAALCSDDSWGTSWADLVQHRFSGDGPLSGHAVGNLLLAALWEILDDPVAGLDAVASLLRVTGRVLPMAAVPLEISARVRQGDEVVLVRGQVDVASAPGEILSVSLSPENPPARPETLTAIADADVLVLGPGSWYSSVISHLLVPEQCQALIASPARKILILNIINPGQPLDETQGDSAERLLEVLHRHAPELKFDAVVADSGSITNEEAVTRACDLLGGRLILANVAKGGAVPHHDPMKLREVLSELILAPENLRR